MSTTASSLLRRFGPKAGNHPSIGQPCPACGVAFAAGDFTTLIPLGPGADPDARERAREGRAFNAVGIEVHSACSTGVEETATFAEPSFRCPRCQRESWHPEDGRHRYCPACKEFFP
jgi:hypothetical protein